VPGLGARLGRGGATTFLQDLVRSDCVVIMGANMAENHPVGFRFVTEARERGATVIHIDPRFTRTSALSDIHVPLRAGSDIVFLGALINWVLEHAAWNEEYVRHYTNATVIVGSDYIDSEDLGGVFSGFDAATGTYDPSSWAMDPGGRVDPAMTDPRCVLQVVRRHFSRYTPELVERACGVPVERFHAVAGAICRNSTPERTTAFCYSVAWTQHTTGTQMIAACAILQLLLGNVGRPGGGIMALRGHATIQGSTDIPTLFNLLPGYLPMPSRLRNHETLAGYLAEVTAPAGWWHNAPAYMVSLLKALYGPNGTPDNAFGYGWLPRIDEDHSFQQMIVDMVDGRLRGLFCMGQNPAVGGQNAKLARRGLAELDWLVVRDPFEIETASFWKDSPEIAEGSQHAEAIGTEVFLMPAALTAEKDGSYTNTQRLVQWHDRAVDPPGDSRSEAWFIHQLALRLFDLYRDETGPAADQLRAIHWPYTAAKDGEPDLLAVLAEINGQRVDDGSQIAGFTDLRDDGSTACGCWIYSGIMPEPEHNRARERAAEGPADVGWGFAWPANRRILYNRASARPDGSPWSERKAWVWWDAAAGQWTGHDIPDFPATKPPAYLPAVDARGIDAHPGDAPFILIADGRGQLFAPILKDGPLPTHYEPWESPVGSALHPGRARSPAARTIRHAGNPYQREQDPAYPHVLTSYRLTEHYTAGGMSRFVPWLAELQPEGFAEIDPQLARDIGVDNGDRVRISTARGAIVTRALVTGRLAPLRVDDRVLHQVGLPWHYGQGGIATGAVANDLSALVEDPNSFIHEAKSFACAIERADPPRPEGGNG
jgi:formate dehydrogenase major subunit